MMDSASRMENGSGNAQQGLSAAAESPSGWFALRSFHCLETAACSYLQELGYEAFVPMRIKERVVDDGRKVERVQVPVVHNYLFMRNSISPRMLRIVVANCPVPLSVIKKTDGTGPSIISEEEMNEFRLFCDPNYAMATFVEAQEAEARPGKEVKVVHGMFKGMHGKLHRVQNKYFLIKTIAGIGVMVRISRWYCKVID